MCHIEASSHIIIVEVLFMIDGILIIIMLVEIIIMIGLIVRGYFGKFIKIGKNEK